MKKELSYKNTVFLLSALALVFGVFTAVLGEIVMPLSAAALAALFSVEEKKGKPVSVVISVVTALTSAVLFFIPGGGVSLVGIFSVITSLIIFLGFKSGVKKSECASYIVVLYVAVAVLTLYLVAVKNTNVFSVSAATEYYKLLYSDLKEYLVKLLEASAEEYKKYGVELALTSDQISLLIDNLAKTVLSLVAIIGFLFTGITYKIFSFIMIKTLEKPEVITNNRFGTSNVFCYFYVILLIGSAFITDYSTPLAVAIINLYNIFLAVYAYLGFDTALRFLSKRRSAVFGFIILLFAIFMLPSLAIEILSVVGVLNMQKRNMIDDQRRGNAV